ncbi:putative mitogen-activated protein kinase kinase kinase 7-like isoform X2 [Drosophila innubila]|uniref:putative mitogen-activated protein kinase kinase kinase 7-like isoform X2 n=1 Tax=Drosophila innubila TaxID=198719 RepID=UPI00148D073D|nr:putative mitogen-activated protein kinase kinase kinase 7-like isoform X2 [Drosophila innubila]
MIKIDFASIKPYLKEENFIGNGTYGRVYKGHLKSKKLDVAIKQIYNINKDVRRESDILRKIDNDHIIQIVATVFDSAKNMYLVLEYMNGGTLYQLVHDKNKNYNFVDVMNWFLQAAKGLNYLHTLTPVIIHRDVKPENMLLDEPRKTLKFCDLGKAREFNTIMTDKTGTGIYIAPEVLNNYPYDTKCDIYSLSISLAETLIRKNPFHKFLDKFQKKPAPLTVAQQIGNTLERPDISETFVPCTDEVQKLITKGWSDTAAERPNAQQFVNLLTMELANEALKPNSVD